MIELKKIILIIILKNGHIRNEILKDKSLSEKAGITIEGDNKWLSLMKTAIKHKNAKTEGV